MFIFLLMYLFTGNCDGISISYVYMYFILIVYFILLGVRSLANASRARQFNRLNPPGVGWVKFFSFFKVRVGSGGGGSGRNFFR